MSEESKLELKDTAFGVQGKADLVVIEPMSNTGAQKVTSDEEAASLQIEDLACEAELEHAETAGPSNDSKFSQSRVDNNGQTNTQFADHFTLKVPSSAVRFRGTTVLVHELRSSQIHLIEKMRSNRSTRQNPSIGDVESEEEHQEHQHEILVKNVKNDKTSGLNLLRLLYSLVCFFFSGMLLLLCFQVLLFLFMDLVVDIGLTTEPRNLSSFIGTLLAVPMFIYGFSSAMSIAGAFVVDTWNGHTFLRKVGNWNIILTEWASFIALLGIPLFTWTILLFAGKDQFWEITLICWFSCVAIYYVFFAFAVMYYEIQASWLLMKELHHRSGGSDDSNERRSFCTIVCRAIVLRQTYQFSGITDTVRMTNVVNEDQVPDHKRTTMYTRMTISGCCTRGRLFEKVDPAERLNSIEEVLGTRQFLTANTWSLEKIFCSNQRTQSVAIVRGPSALLPAQMRSSLICSIGGIVLAILALVAVLVWLNNTGLVIFFLVLIIVLSCIPRVQSSIRIYRMYKDVLEAQDEQDGMYINTSVETDGIYQTFEKYRVSRPSLGFCWFLFWLEICIFLIWPLITLFAIQNYPIAVLFLTVSIITAIRYFLNPCILLNEIGSFDIIGRTEERGVTGPYADHQWKAKSRLSAILLHVTRGPSRQAWMWVFFFLAFGIIIFTVATLGTTTDTDDADSSSFTVLPRGNFTYQPLPNLPYPSCALAKGLEIPMSNSTALADYAFLAGMAYQPSASFQDDLDAWFGPDIATDESEIVRNFRDSIEGGRAHVDYHLISFPGRFAVISVRGSTTPWEWLTDAQLWSGAAVSGFIRSFLPFGAIWTPIIDNLLKAISIVESESLDKVSLYQQTTSFVQALEQSGNYDKLHITGHSLGGGIALITGAQTRIPAIAMSGPNAMLSRKTFDPEITPEAINEFLFNVIPERDFIPRIDDVGMLSQNIKCRAKKNDLWGCHSSIRTLCEISYTCGSFKRPPLCDCATKYGFPPAQQIAGDESFTDICGDRRSNDGL